MTRQPETFTIAPQHSQLEHCGWWLRPALAVLLISAAYFCRLDRPLLWDDEAETGVVARNILRAGYPTASDGRNVTLYQNGAELNDRLVYKNIPWLQYYAGAVSILVFGNTTAGLRNEAGNETNSNVAMVALPRWTQNIALLYLGDHYLVRPILNHPADKCMDAMRKNLGEQACNNLFGMPEWILDANNAYKTLSGVPEGYQVVATFDSHQKEMADGSRPELTRHSFPRPEVTGTMKLYRFVKK